MSSIDIAAYCLGGSGPVAAIPAASNGIDGSGVPWSDWIFPSQLAKPLKGWIILKEPETDPSPIVQSKEGAGCTPHHGSDDHCYAHRGKLISPVSADQKSAD